MNARRGLASLGLSVLMHALLVLCIGFSLNQPERSIRHIEVDLAPAEKAVQHVEKAPAAPASPEPAPEPSKPEPEPSPQPLPKPAVTPPRHKPAVKPAVRPLKQQPVAAKIETTEPLTMETPQESDAGHQEQPTDPAALAAGSKSSASIAAPPARSARTTDASALEAWLAAVRARIEAAKRYPFAAEQRRIQGIVTVNFRLSLEGRLLDAPAIAGSSGFSLLDTAALRAIRRAEPFPRFPGPAEDMPRGPLSVELKFMMQ